MSGAIVQFNEGDVTQTHIYTIAISNDIVCENNTEKTFLSSIALESGIPVINVTTSQATVFIECGRHIT